MRAKDFLAEFDDYHFPQVVGPWVGLDDHDPPWTRAQLKQMERQNLIELNRGDTHYRLTLKATKVRCRFEGCIREYGLDTELLRKDADELRAIGGQMANVFFNWSQEANSVGGRLDASDREMLRGLLKQWDSAARRRPKQDIKGGL